MPPKQKKIGDLDRSEMEEMISKAVASAVESAVVGMESSIEKLREELRGYQTALKKRDAEIIELRERLDEQEQYGRRNNIRIFGVAEHDGEDTDQLVINVAKKINVDIDKSLIDRSHRVGKKGTKPRAIIVKFTSYATRRKVFIAKKGLKGSNTTIREDLTKCRLDLLHKAIEVFSFENVWTSDGVVFIKIPNMRPYRVRTLKKLDELISQYAD